MNFFDIKSLGDALGNLSRMCENALYTNNTDMIKAALSSASVIAESVERQVVELLVCTKFADFFDKRLYDCIEVKRIDEGSYKATFSIDVEGKSIEFIGYGQSYEEARTHVICDGVCEWISDECIDHPSPEKEKNTVKLKIKVKGVNDTNDVDEGFVKASGGCSGNCSACDHEDE